MCDEITAVEGYFYYALTSLSLRNQCRYATGHQSLLECATGIQFRHFLGSQFGAHALHVTHSDALEFVVGPKRDTGFTCPRSVWLLDR